MWQWDGREWDFVDHDWGGGYWHQEGVTHPAEPCTYPRYYFIRTNHYVQNGSGAYASGVTENMQFVSC